MPSPKRTAGDTVTSAAPTRRRRSPRTQEERSAATRAKVIQAATECVAELGFRAATMGAIAERAGVSWGAIQHQFGEKDALLDAVLEEAMLGLRSGLSDIRALESDPAQRVRKFVRRGRDTLKGPLYRAFFEIQIARSRESDDASDAWSTYVANTLGDSWGELFGDLAVPKRTLVAAQRFTFAVLSGIAAESMLFPAASNSDTQLEILEQTLLRLLELER